MRKLAASWREISCLLGNIVAELGPPCETCGNTDGLTVSGTSPDGRAVCMTIMPDGVVEIEGCEDLVDVIHRRPCAAKTGGKTQ